MHLSGNPGLKDHVISKIQGKLKATYEPPIIHQTFKPLIKAFDAKNGGPKKKGDRYESLGWENSKRRSILDDIMEKESLSSADLEADYSDKHM